LQVGEVAKYEREVGDVAKYEREVGEVAKYEREVGEVAKYEREQVTSLRMGETIRKSERDIHAKTELQAAGEEKNSTYKIKRK
jgi:hypothetical protein